MGGVPTREQEDILDEKSLDLDMMMDMVPKVLPLSGGIVDVHNEFLGRHEVGKEHKQWFFVICRRALCGNIGGLREHQDGKSTRYEGHNPSIY